MPDVLTEEKWYDYAKLTAYRRTENNGYKTEEMLKHIYEVPRTLVSILDCHNI